MAATASDSYNSYQQQVNTNNGNAYSNTAPPLYIDVPSAVPIQQQYTTGPPPTYDEANDPNAPPPSYESLFGRVREAKRNSTGVLDFLKKLLILILGTIGCTVIIGVTVVVPITMIIIGSVYMHDCKAEPYIPVYLVVGGVFGVIKNMMNFRTRCKSRNESEEENLRPNPTDTIINCFLFAWFITGCVWVYRVYRPDYENQLSDDYCNRTLYLFSFWLVTSAYIVFGIVTLCLCCIGAVALSIQPN